MHRNESQENRNEVIMSRFRDGRKTDGRRAGVTSRKFGSQRRRALFRLEPLEERTLLTSFSWVGSSHGDWSDPNNWSDGTDDGAVPGPGDYAYINSYIISNINIISDYTINNISIFVPSGEDLTLTGLTQATEVSIDAEGDLNLPDLTSIAGSADGNDGLMIGARDGGRIDFPALTQVSGAVGFSADDGVLNFPELTTLDGVSTNSWNYGCEVNDGGEIDFGADSLQTQGQESFTVNGDGSVLSLPDLTSIVGSTVNANSVMSVGAKDGGAIDLGADSLQLQGSIEIGADGDGSLLSLPNLSIHRRRRGRDPLPGLRRQ